jgi:hypothetical protein
MLFLQEAAASPDASASTNQFTLTEMVKNMGGVAIAVVVVLLIMSVYSIAIMVERYLTYSAAKKQSREFAPRVAQALKNDRIEEAINISDKHRKSHLAMVVSSGLQEFRAHEASSDISGDEIDASKRALQRAIAIKTAEFKRGLSGLANDRLHGSVCGIVWYGVRHHQRIPRYEERRVSRYRGCGRRYFGSVVYNCTRFAGRGACGVALQLLHR